MSDDGPSSQTYLENGFHEAQCDQHSVTDLTTSSQSQNQNQKLCPCMRLRIYDCLEQFQFSMPSGWTPKKIDIFLQSCRFYHSDLISTETDSKIWRRIARFGGRIAKDETLFNVNNCIELAQCLRSYAERNIKKLSDNSNFLEYLKNIKDFVDYFPKVGVLDVTDPSFKERAKHFNDDLLHYINSKESFKSKLSNFTPTLSITSSNNENCDILFSELKSKRKRKKKHNNKRSKRKKVTRNAKKNKNLQQKKPNEPFTEINDLLVKSGSLLPSLTDLSTTDQSEKSKEISEGSSSKISTLNEENQKRERCLKLFMEDHNYGKNPHEMINIPYSCRNGTVITPVVTFDNDDEVSSSLNPSGENIVISADAAVVSSTMEDTVDPKGTLNHLFTASDIDSVHVPIENLTECVVPGTSITSTKKTGDTIMNRAPPKLVTSNLRFPTIDDKARSSDIIGFDKTALEDKVCNTVINSAKCDEINPSKRNKTKKKKCRCHTKNGDINSKRNKRRKKKCRFHTKNEEIQEHSSISSERKEKELIYDISNLHSVENTSSHRREKAENQKSTFLAPLNKTDEQAATTSHLQQSDEIVSVEKTKKLKDSTTISEENKMGLSAERSVNEGKNVASSNSPPNKESNMIDSSEPSQTPNRFLNTKPGIVENSSSLINIGDHETYQSKDRENSLREIKEVRPDKNNKKMLSITLLGRGSNDSSSDNRYPFLLTDSNCIEGNSKSEERQGQLLSTKKTDTHEPFTTSFRKSDKDELSSHLISQDENQVRRKENSSTNGTVISPAVTFYNDDEFSSSLNSSGENFVISADAALVSSTMENTVDPKGNLNHLFTASDIDSVQVPIENLTESVVPGTSITSMKKTGDTIMNRAPPKLVTSKLRFPTIDDKARSSDIIGFDKTALEDKVCNTVINSAKCDEINPTKRNKTKKKKCRCHTKNGDINSKRNKRRKKKCRFHTKNEEIQEHSSISSERKEKELIYDISNLHSVENTSSHRREKAENQKSTFLAPLNKTDEQAATTCHLQQSDEILSVEKTKKLKDSTTISEENKMGLSAERSVNEGKNEASSNSPPNKESNMIDSSEPSQTPNRFLNTKPGIVENSSSLINIGDHDTYQSKDRENSLREIKEVRPDKNNKKMLSITLLGRGSNDSSSDNRYPFLLTDSNCIEGHSKSEERQGQLLSTKKTDTHEPFTTSFRKSDKDELSSHLISQDENHVRRKENSSTNGTVISPAVTFYNDDEFSSSLNSSGENFVISADAALVSSTMENTVDPKGNLNHLFTVSDIDSVQVPIENLTESVVPGTSITSMKKTGDTIMNRAPPKLVTSKLRFPTIDDKARSSDIIGFDKTALEDKVCNTVINSAKCDEINPTKRNKTKKKKCRCHTKNGDINSKRNKRRKKKCRIHTKNEEIQEHSSISSERKEKELIYDISNLHSVENTSSHRREKAENQKSTFLAPLNKTDEQAATTSHLQQSDEILSVEKTKKLKDSTTISEENKMGLSAERSVNKGKNEASSNSPPNKESNMIDSSEPSQTPNRFLNTKPGIVENSPSLINICDHESYQSKDRENSLREIKKVRPDKNNKKILSISLLERVSNDSSSDNRYPFLLTDSNCIEGNSKSEERQGQLLSTKKTDTHEPFTTSFRKSDKDELSSHLISQDENHVRRKENSSTNGTVISPAVTFYNDDEFSSSLNSSGENFVISADAALVSSTMENTVDPKGNLNHLFTVSDIDSVQVPIENLTESVVPGTSITSMKKTGDTIMNRAPPKLVTSKLRFPTIDDKARSSDIIGFDKTALEDKVCNTVINSAKCDEINPTKRNKTKKKKCRCHTKNGDINSKRNKRRKKKCRFHTKNEEIQEHSSISSERKEKELIYDISNLHSVENTSSHRREKAENQKSTFLAPLNKTDEQAATTSHLQQSDEILSVEKTKKLKDSTSISEENKIGLSAERSVNEGKNEASSNSPPNKESNMIDSSEPSQTPNRFLNTKPGIVENSPSLINIGDHETYQSKDRENSLREIKEVRPDKNNKKILSISLLERVSNDSSSDNRYPFLLTDSNCIEGNSKSEERQGQFLSTKKTDTHEPFITSFRKSDKDELSSHLISQDENHVRRKENSSTNGTVISPAVTFYNDDEFSSSLNSSGENFVISADAALVSSTMKNTVDPKGNLNHLFTASDIDSVQVPIENLTESVVPGTSITSMKKTGDTIMNRAPPKLVTSKLRFPTIDDKARSSDIIGFDKTVLEDKVCNTVINSAKCDEINPTKRNKTKKKKCRCHTKNGDINSKRNKRRKKKCRFHTKNKEIQEHSSISSERKEKELIYDISNLHSVKNTSSHRREKAENQKSTFLTPLNKTDEPAATTSHLQQSDEILSVEKTKKLKDSTTISEENKMGLSAEKFVNEGKNEAPSNSPPNKESNMIDSSEPSQTPNRFLNTKPGIVENSSSLINIGDHETYQSKDSENSLREIKEVRPDKNNKKMLSISLLERVSNDSSSDNRYPFLLTDSNCIEGNSKSEERQGQLLSTKKTDTHEPFTTSFRKSDKDELSSHLISQDENHVRRKENSSTNGTVISPAVTFYNDDEFSSSLNSSGENFVISADAALVSSTMENTVDPKGNLNHLFTVSDIDSVQVPIENLTESVVPGTSITSMKKTGDTIMNRAPPKKVTSKLRFPTIDDKARSSDPAGGEDMSPTKKRYNLGLSTLSARGESIKKVSSNSSQTSHFADNLPAEEKRVLKERKDKSPTTKVLTKEYSDTSPNKESNMIDSSEPSQTPNRFINTLSTLEKGVGISSNESLQSHLVENVPEDKPRQLRKRKAEPLDCRKKNKTVSSKLSQERHLFENIPVVGNEGIEFSHNDKTSSDILSQSFSNNIPAIEGSLRNKKHRVLSKKSDRELATETNAMPLDDLPSLGNTILRQDRSTLTRNREKRVNSPSKRNSNVAFSSGVNDIPHIKVRSSINLADNEVKCLNSSSNKAHLFKNIISDESHVGRKENSDEIQAPSSSLSTLEKGVGISSNESLQSHLVQIVPEDKPRQLRKRKAEPLNCRKKNKTVSSKLSQERHLFENIPVVGNEGIEFSHNDKTSSDILSQSFSNNIPAIEGSLRNKKHRVLSKKSDRELDTETNAMPLDDLPSLGNTILRQDRSTLTRNREKRVNSPSKRNSNVAFSSGVNDIPHIKVRSSINLADNEVKCLNSSSNKAHLFKNIISDESHVGRKENSDEIQAPSSSLSTLEKGVGISSNESLQSHLVQIVPEDKPRQLRKRKAEPLNCRKKNKTVSSKLSQERHLFENIPVVGNEGIEISRNDKTSSDILSQSFSNNIPAIEGSLRNKKHRVLSKKSDRELDTETNAMPLDDLPSLGNTILRQDRSTLTRNREKRVNSPSKRNSNVAFSSGVNDIPHIKVRSSINLADNEVKCLNSSSNKAHLFKNIISDESHVGRKENSDEIQAPSSSLSTLEKGVGISSNESLQSHLVQIVPEDKPRQLRKRKAEPLNCRKKNKTVSSKLSQERHLFENIPVVGNEGIEFSHNDKTSSDILSQSFSNNIPAIEGSLRNKKHRVLSKKSDRELDTETNAMPLDDLPSLGNTILRQDRSTLTRNREKRVNSPSKRNSNVAFSSGVNDIPHIKVRSSINLADNEVKCLNSSSNKAHLFKNIISDESHVGRKENSDEIQAPSSSLSTLEKGVGISSNESLQSHLVQIVPEDKPRQLRKRKAEPLNCRKKNKTVSSKLSQERHLFENIPVVGNEGIEISRNDKTSSDILSQSFSNNIPAIEGSLRNKKHRVLSKKSDRELDTETNAMPLDDLPSLGNTILRQDRSTLTRNREKRVNSPSKRNSNVAFSSGVNDIPHIKVRSSINLADNEVKCLNSSSNKAHLFKNIISDESHVGRKENSDEIQAPSSSLSTLEKGVGISSNESLQSHLVQIVPEDKPRQLRKRRAEPLNCRKKNKTVSSKLSQERHLFENIPVVGNEGIEISLNDKTSSDILSQSFSYNIPAIEGSLRNKKHRVLSKKSDRELATETNAMPLDDLPSLGNTILRQDRSTPIRNREKCVNSPSKRNSNLAFSLSVNNGLERNISHENNNQENQPSSLPEGNVEASIKNCTVTLSGRPYSKAENEICMARKSLLPIADMHNMPSTSTSDDSHKFLPRNIYNNDSDNANTMINFKGFKKGTKGVKRKKTSIKPSNRKHFFSCSRPSSCSGEFAPTVYPSQGGTNNRYFPPYQFPPAEERDVASPPTVVEVAPVRAQEEERVVDPNLQPHIRQDEVNLPLEQQQRLDFLMANYENEEGFRYSYDYDSNWFCDYAQNVFNWGRNRLRRLFRENDERRRREEEKMAPLLQSLQDILKRH